MYKKYKIQRDYWNTKIKNSVTMATRKQAQFITFFIVVQTYSTHIIFISCKAEICSKYSLGLDLTVIYL